MNKILYIDTETTGLSPQKHGLIQLACIVVQNEFEIDRLNLMINPMTYKHDVIIEESALAINGKTLDEIEYYPHSDIQIALFEEFLAKHTDDGKMQVAGYNVEFDIWFIKDWIKGHFKYGDYLNYKTLDILSLVRHIDYMQWENWESHKLVDMCGQFGIQLEAHDAMNDIEATLQLHNKLIHSIYPRSTFGCKAEDIKPVEPTKLIEEINLNLSVLADYLKKT